MLRCPYDSARMVATSSYDNSSIAFLTAVSTSRRSSAVSRNRAAPRPSGGRFRLPQRPCPRQCSARTPQRRFADFQRSCRSDPDDGRYVAGRVHERMTRPCRVLMIFSPDSGKRSLEVRSEARRISKRRVQDRSQSGLACRDAIRNITARSPKNASQTA